MCGRGGGKKKWKTVAEWMMMTDAERKLWSGAEGITNLRLIADPGLPNLPKGYDGWDAELKKLPRNPEDA